MGWFGKTEEEPIPVEEEVQEDQSGERLKNLEARKKEMALQIVDALLEPTETLKIEWRVDDRRTTYPTYTAFVGGFGGKFIEVCDHGTFFEIVLRDSGSSGIAFLRETFHHSYRGDDNDDYVKIALLVQAIRRQPEFLEEAFQQVMDYIAGREYDDEPEEETNGDV